MSLFDAINHAMSAISTGGFSTSDQSLAKWDNRRCTGSRW
jgi:trk system potassium uptake protein TrkH